MIKTISGPRFTALHAEIVDRIQTGEFPSVSIGVLQADRLLWCESIGLADVEKGRPATTSTPYALASLGKSITASAVMVLVDRLLVNLNAPISQYIGEESLSIFDGNSDQVTVRRVLNMTAGIPHGHMIFNKRDYLMQYSIDHLVANRGLVVFPPGEVYLYSNFAYALLEKLVQDVSGSSFNEFLCEELFDPLDMRDSFVSPDKPLEMTAPAALYLQNGTRIKPYFMLPRNSLAIYASLNDLLNFAKFQLGTGAFIRRPFYERTLEKMHDMRGEAPGAIIALGLASTDLADGRLWLLTNGRAGGMQATLSMLPSERLAVVCLINATGQASDDLAFRITDLLIPGFLERALQVINRYESWSERPFKPSSQLLGFWSGTIQYQDRRVPIELFFSDDGAISASLAGSPESYLSGVGFRNGLLSGDLRVVLPMEEAQYAAHKVTLSLRLKGSQLSGTATSEITNYRGNFSLAGYVRLTKGRQSQPENMISLSFSE
jgi:CubicO group peptidase (beta-lactamase class C family)